jgi:hypothetical protein
MKVLNLRCANGHGFEGWFASDDDFMDQNGRGMVECPLCADRIVTRLPTAPRLNLSGASAPADNAPPRQPSPDTMTATTTVALPDLQAAWLQAVRHVLANTEDVGTRFAVEARRIHYGEQPSRGIRGQATPEQRAELLDEGIEIVSLPLPRGLDGPVQ